MSNPKPFYFPVGRDTDGAMVKCDHCGQWGRHLAWTNGENTVTVGDDCAVKLGFREGFNAAQRESMIEIAIRFAGESGFVASFGASCRDRLMGGKRLSERQCEVFGKLCREREILNFRAGLCAEFGLEYA